MQRRNLAVAVAWLLLAVSPAAAQTDYWWLTDDDGSWTDVGNWAPPGYPDGPGDGALFDLFLSAPVTVDVNAPVTVGRILLKDLDWNSPRFTLAPGPGEGSLTFDGGGGGASIEGFGRHEIAAPILLSDTLWIENADERELELELVLSGGVSGGVGRDFVLDGMYLGVELTAPSNPIQGAVIVYPTVPYGEASGLNLRGGATVLGATRFEAHLGAVIGLDNAVTNVGNRVASPVQLFGGGLGLHGNAAATTEAIPRVELVKGSCSLAVANFPGGAAPTLDIGTLVRAPGTTVEFLGWELGSADIIRINHPAGPPRDWGGLIGGWAVVNDWLGQNFATYGVGMGVVALPFYASDIKTAGAWENVLLSAPDVLWFSNTINSLKMVGDATLNLQGHSLDITSGGLLCTLTAGAVGTEGPAVQGLAGPPAVISNGQLTAGGMVPEDPELVIHVRQDLQIAANIVDNGVAPVALTVSSYSLPWWAFAPFLDPVLTLSGLNTYSGPTTICSARVAADSDARFGHPAGRLVLAGGIVQATSTFTTSRWVEVFDGAAFEVVAGRTLTLAGGVSGDASELHVRALADGGAPQATLVLAAPNTFRADIVVGEGGGTGPTPVLQVSSDANLGDPDQDIVLNRGAFRAAGSFAAHPGRIFVIDGGGGTFDVSAGKVFSLDAEGQLEGGGVGMKVGPGKMVVSAANLNYWGQDMEVAEGILELGDARALNARHITLAGGVVNLRHDSDVEFPDDVTVRGTGGIDVDGSAAADPVLSIAGLELQENATLTVTGGPGYSLAVAGDTDVLGLIGTIRTETADLTLGGTLRMNEPTAMLVKEGPATLTVGGPQEPAALASLRAIDGTTNIDTDGGGQGAPPVRNLTVEVHGADAVVNFRHAQHLAGIRLASGGTATAAAVGINTLVTNALTIDPDLHGAPAGTLDLADNNLVVDYTGGTSPFDEIVGWVRSGLRDGPTGYWDGPGIASSAAAAMALTALAVIDNNDPNPKIGGLTDLDGEPVSAESVLVKYTWWGDADLDGVIDSNDYDLLDNTFARYDPQNPAPPAGGWRWGVGDFTYDGVVDSNDYDKIDNAFKQQTGALGSNLGLPVPMPEPATLALLAVGALVLVKRRP